MTDAKSQSALQTFVANLPDPMTVGFSSSFLNNPNASGDEISINTGQEDLIRIIVSHSNGDPNDTIYSSTAIAIPVFIGDNVFVDALNNSTQIICNTSFLSNINTITVSDAGTGNINSEPICVQSSIPLPITYSKPLEAIQNQKSTNLTWSVATQINNDKYIIEHSTDGREFSIIGEIDGDGTNNGERHYTYYHNLTSLGINYYRIKQVDFDGQYSYSNIASVMFNGDGREISIYPNPATDEVTLSVTEDTEVSVVDMMGRVIKKQTINKENNRIDISELPKGIFIFTIGSNNIQRLVKQ